MAAPDLTPVVSEPVATEQSCEACQEKVRLLVVRTPPGSPDLIRSIFPDNAWIGWSLTGESDPQVRVLVLCSRACVVEWFDLEHGPGA